MSWFRLKLRLPIVNHLTRFTSSHSASLACDPCRKPAKPAGSRVGPTFHCRCHHGGRAGEVCFGGINVLAAPMTIFRVSAMMLLRAREMHLRMAHRELDINAAYSPCETLVPRSSNGGGCAAARPTISLISTNFMPDPAHGCELSSKG